MSKSSTASASKIPTQLPQKSAWSRGPPQTSASSAAASTSASPRSQSPAPSQNASQFPTTQSHSRRPSALGQGVSIKDGVSIPRSNVGAANAKQGSAVTFGSIDDAAAPISSSPASVPPIKSEGVKSFGSVPATNSSPVNGKAPPSFASNLAGPSSLKQSSPSTSSSPVAPKAPIPLVSNSASASLSSSSAPAPSTTPTPKLNKADIRKLFQNPSASAPPPSSSNSDTSSPALRPTNALPSTSSHASTSFQPSQPSQSSQLPNFTPFVPSAGFRQPTSTNSSASTSRSPAYPRQMTNGTSGGVGVGNRQSGPPGTPGAAQNVQTGMSSPRLGPPPHGGQPPAGLPPGQPYYHPQYYYPSYPVPTEHYMPYSPWMGNPMQPPPPHHPQQGGTPGPHPSPLPMSPRNPPPQLQQPGTPTQAPTLPTPSHPPPSSPSTHTISHTHSSSISSPPPTPSTASGPSGPGGATGPNGARLNTDARTFVPKRITIKNQDGREVDLEGWRKRESLSSPPSAPPSSTSQKRTSVVRMETVEAKNKRLAEEEKERAKKAADEEAKKAAEEEKRRKEEEETERLRQEEEKEKERVRKEEEKKRKEQEEKEKAEEEERLRKKEEQRLKEEEARLQKEADERKLEEQAQAELDNEDQTETEEGELVEKELPSDEQATKREEAALLKRESLRIDTSLSLSDAKRRPGPLDLSNTSKAVVTPPQPSALASARIIEDLGNVLYPDGIMSPKVELNVNAKNGKFRYDRDFLLQFMAVCKEKPDSLPPLDAIGLEPTDQSSFAMARGGSGRRQSSTGLPPPLSRQASVGLGISGFKASPSGNFSMGNFATPTSKMTSEERFAMSSGNRVASATVGGQSGMPFGRPAPMVRSASQGGSGALGSNRTRSKRGEKRNDANKVNAPTSYATQVPSSMGGMSAFEPVQPLEMSANRWTRKVPVAEPDSPEVVERKVKGLLNKLTMEKFDSISDQIINWANKSENEKDGRTLIQVIKLVFEKATDEAAWSEMYARLCRKMMERISPNVQDDGIKNTEGKPIAGGQLFRKYLLNRCQEDFERGWAAKDAAASAAAAKASEDEAAKKAAETTGEAELYSEEYYTAQKAKRQGLGLIQFIGELYKLQMLTERIMHECIKKLLGNVDNPEEEEIESLCRLLTTVGQLLDNVKARAHMDIYFSRMKELIKSSNVSSRMHFMLQDLIELRERKWVPRNQVAAPATIAQIHEAAAKERLAHEKEASTRTLSMSRGGSRRGGDRGPGGEQMQGADGWSVAGGGQPRPQPKAGDLSNFGKINKTAPMTFGPSSVFAGKKETTKRDSALSRTNSSSNMFSMLNEDEKSTTAGSAVKSSRPSSRRTSVDFGQSGVPEPPAQRRKLQLLPRTKPVEETKANGASEDQSEEESDAEENAPLMSEEEAEKKIVEDIKEFFGIRNIDESEDYFSKLPSEYRHRLVDKMVTKAIESKEADAQLVADTFRRAVEKNLCSLESFQEGFIPTAEILDDIAIDAPKAFGLMAIMMIGAGLDKDEERYSRIADKLEDKDQLLSHFT